MRDPLVQGAAGRLARLLPAAPLAIVEPAVIQAAEAAVLEAPVAQVGPTMRAVDPQQTGLARLIAEENEVLAQQADREGRPAGGRSSDKAAGCQ